MKKETYVNTQQKRLIHDTLIRHIWSNICTECIHEKKWSIYTRKKYLFTTRIPGVFGATYVVSDGAFPEEALMLVSQLSATPYQGYQHIRINLVFKLLLVNMQTFFFQSLQPVIFVGSLFHIFSNHAKLLKIHRFFVYKYIWFFFQPLCDSRYVYT